MSEGGAKDLGTEAERTGEGALSPEYDRRTDDHLSRVTDLDIRLDEEPSSLTMLDSATSATGEDVAGVAPPVVEFVDGVGRGVNTAATGLRELCVLDADEGAGGGAPIFKMPVSSPLGVNPAALGLKLNGAMLPSAVLRGFSKMRYLRLEQEVHDKMWSGCFE